jgi:hypothetical protein
MFFYLVVNTVWTTGKYQQFGESSILPHSVTTSETTLNSFYEDL